MKVRFWSKVKIGTADDYGVSLSQVKRIRAGTQWT